MIVLADGAQDQPGPRRLAGTTQTATTMISDEIDERRIAEDHLPDRIASPARAETPSRTAATILPTKGWPISAEKPVPKIVSASPVATWLDDSVSVRKPKIIDASAPAPAARQHAEPGIAGDRR